MKKLIAANWKMNYGANDAVPFVNELKHQIGNENHCDVLLCVPFTSLAIVKDVLKGSFIKLGAQNMHFEDSGAYTGEISPLMIKSLGCEYVILGHSERRESGEDDLLINKKLHSALKHGLKPILCVGENLHERENGWTEEVIEKQLNNCMGSISMDQAKNVTIAYEPVWAISKGNPNAKAATSKDAENAHLFIKNVLRAIFRQDVADSIRILYGGSMKPENAKELLSIKSIDGGLVGNASLNAKSFSEVVKAAN